MAPVNCAGDQATLTVQSVWVEARSLLLVGAGGVGTVAAMLGWSRRQRNSGMGQRRSISDQGVLGEWFWVQHQPGWLCESVESDLDRMERAGRVDWSRIGWSDAALAVVRSRLGSSRSALDERGLEVWERMERCATRLEQIRVAVGQADFDDRVVHRVAAALVATEGLGAGFDPAEAEEYRPGFAAADGDFVSWRDHAVWGLPDIHCPVAEGLTTALLADPAARTPTVVTVFDWLSVAAGGRALWWVPALTTAVFGRFGVCPTGSPPRDAVMVVPALVSGFLVRTLHGRTGVFAVPIPSDDPSAVFEEVATSLRRCANPVRRQAAITAGFPRVGPHGDAMMPWMCAGSDVSGEGADPVG